MFFFLQAEDGIRDYKVTGVQTCALPISADRYTGQPMPATAGPPLLATSPGCCRWRCRRSHDPGGAAGTAADPGADQARSGERRVGEEGRSLWSPDHLKKKTSGV